MVLQKPLSTSELITETADIMNVVQGEEKTDSRKVTSPVKRKSKFINCSLKRSDQKKN